MAKITAPDKRKKESSIKIADLFFYFDGQERNRIDQGRVGRKTGQVMALREKLLSLPEPEFDVAIRTIENIVTPINGAGQAVTASGTRINRDALDLFERTSKSGSKASTAEKTSRI